MLFLKKYHLKKRLLCELSLSWKAQATKRLISQLRCTSISMSLTLYAELFLCTKFTEMVYDNSTWTYLWQRFIYLFANFSLEKSANRLLHVWMVDCFQGYIEGGYAVFFHISLLYLYAWIRAKMSPGIRPSVQPLDMERGGTHNCIKETASRDSSCACNIIVPFDSIIIINLAMKKKTRRNTNRPRDNAAARVIDVYRFVSHRQRSPISSRRVSI